jgi:hypothetical protein
MEYQGLRMRLGFVTPTARVKPKSEARGPALGEGISLQFPDYPVLLDNEI